MYEKLKWETRIVESLFVLKDTIITWRGNPYDTTKFAPICSTNYNTYNFFGQAMYPIFFFSTAVDFCVSIAWGLRDV